MTLKKFIDTLNQAVYQNPIMLDKEITDVETLMVESGNAKTVESIKLSINVATGNTYHIIADWKH